MTLPDERTRAVHAAREFLLDLLDPKKTPRVPRDIRLRAHSVLRHYPWISDMRRSDHFDWDLKYGPCTCPKMDNADLAGTGLRWVTGGCPIHT